ncbi:MAG: pilin [Candidatus Paceibacterota bacterium]
MSKNLRLLLAITVAYYPLTVLAQAQTLKTLISTVAGYFNSILALIMGLAVVIFVWYIIQYYIRPNENRAEAAQYVMWAVLGFFIILSMWGIVNVLINTFNLGTNNPKSWSSIQDLFPTSGGSSNTNVNTSNQNSSVTPAQSSQPSSNSSASSGATVPDSNPTSNQSSQEVWEIDQNALSQYKQNISTGTAIGDRSLSTARALDLAAKKGVVLKQGSVVQYSTTGGVPTSISVDGKNVPLSTSDYVAAEIRTINAAQSAGKALGQ